MSGRGRLIAVEGIDGSGKTTQAKRLAVALGAELTHEPGSTMLGRSLRQLLLDPSTGLVDPMAEALLMCADRAQHVEEVVRPSLSAGRWVVSDRYSGSTLAYQGYGRGIPLDDLARLVDLATGGLRADLSVLIDLDPSVAGGRASAVPDRLERLDADFHRRVRQGYLELAEAGAGRWTVVDGSGTVDQVAEAVRQAVELVLGPAAGESP
ncbi:MAG TPA: dTMP kinase [Acidimicrobiales bacterium]|nr:dTMP kinase [Acidimicrobiales bacterium]